MPRGPKGEKRPADVIGNAVHVMRIATGEIEESATTTVGRNKSNSASKGGQIRAQNLTAEKRVEIAKKGANRRWGTKTLARGTKERT
jgi:hypothetical protein